MSKKPNKRNKAIHIQISYPKHTAVRHTHHIPAPSSKVVEAKYARMKDQSDSSHSFPRKFSCNKQTEIVCSHRANLRLQVER